MPAVWSVELLLSKCSSRAAVTARCNKLCYRLIRKCEAHIYCKEQKFEKLSAETGEFKLSVKTGEFLFV